MSSASTLSESDSSSVCLGELASGTGWFGDSAIGRSRLVTLALLRAGDTLAYGTCKHLCQFHEVFDGDLQPVSYTHLTLPTTPYV